MKSTKYIILFSSCILLLLPKKTAQACGFMVAPGEFRFWLMQPDLTNESDLTPFFLLQLIYINRICMQVRNLTLKKI
jgi:hypothetical protein